MKVIELKFGTVFLVSSYHIATKSKGQFPFSIVVFVFSFRVQEIPHLHIRVCRIGEQRFPWNGGAVCRTEDHVWHRLLLRDRHFGLFEGWCSCGVSCGHVVPYIMLHKVVLRYHSLFIALGGGGGRVGEFFEGGTESFRRNGRGISHANRVLRGEGGEDGNRKLTVDYWLLTADDEGMERYQYTTGPKGGMGGYFFVTQPKSSDFFPPPLLVINNDRSQCVEETLVCDHSSESWKEKNSYGTIYYVVKVDLSL